MNCEEALLRLHAGNERFVLGQPIHPHEGQAWRRHLLHGCNPIATILGCSDPAVSPELVFDQGLGDLCVIRVAGNIVAPEGLGSMQFATAHLGTRLHVVLGHADCPTVAAALEERAGQARQPGRIEVVVRLILPGLKNISLAGDHTQQLAAAVEANVRWSVQQLTAVPEARKLLERRELKVVGAIYDPKTGKVRFLD
jgi:carbonic anhydrase